MRLGLGCNTLGSASHRLSARQQVRLVHAAIDLGVTVFDTADAYGRGGSELLLGRALRGRHEDVTVATKVGYLFDEPSPLARRARRLAARVVVPTRALIRRLDSRFDSGGPRVAVAGSGGADYGSASFSQEYLRAAVDASRRRLGVDRLDVVMLHGPARVDDQPVEALRQMQDEGCLGSIGVGTETEESAVAWAQHGRVDVVEFGTRIGRNEVTSAVLAADSDAWLRGVIRGGMGADDVAQAESLAALASEVGSSRLALDAAWVRQRARPDLVVVGASSVGHLAEFVTALRSADLEDEVLDRLESIRGD